MLLWEEFLGACSCIARLIVSLLVSTVYKERLTGPSDRSCSLQTKSFLSSYMYQSAGPFETGGKVEVEEYMFDFWSSL